MAVDTSGGHKSMDYSEHERTYRLFLKGSAYLAVTCAVILALLAIFVV